MDQFSYVERFIAAAGRSRRYGEIASLLEEATERLGFDYFALVHHVDLRTAQSEGRIALWSYPSSWVEEYLERSLSANDPVHLASHRTNVGFSWDAVSQLIEVTPAHRQVRDQTRRAGIDQGFTVPANIPGETHGSCSFAMATGRMLPAASLPAAQLIGAFAFHAARMLATRDRSEVPHPRLSPRQLECIVLVGRGASDREAAKALGVVEDTVTEYLDDARRRYEVKRRTQLVLRAIFDGQIALSDVLKGPPPLRGEASLH